jgi:hypothetical protein
LETGRLVEEVERAIVEVPEEAAVDTLAAAHVAAAAAVAAALLVAAVLLAAVVVVPQAWSCSPLSWPT